MVDHEKDEAEDTYNCDDDNGADSILNEALASGQAVQIFRKPKEDKQSRITLMGFSWGDDVPEEDVVTAQPASLCSQRRTARENLKAAQDKKTNQNHRQRGVPRALTFGAEGLETAALRKLQILAPDSTSSTPARSFSPPRRPLTRSLTHQNSYDAPSSSSDAIKHSPAYTTHEETIKRLTIQDDEIQQILQDPVAFGKLQKVLRKHGAVTNEVLKQVLPLYVKHQLNAQATKEAERKQREDQMKRRERQALVGAIQEHSARNLGFDHHLE